MLTCFVIVMVSVPLLMSQDLAAASSGAKRLLDTLNNKRMAACDAAWEESADAEEGTPRKIIAETWTAPRTLGVLSATALGGDLFGCEGSAVALLQARVRVQMSFAAWQRRTGSEGGSNAPR